MTTFNCGSCAVENSFKASMITYAVCSRRLFLLNLKTVYTLINIYQSIMFYSKFHIDRNFLSKAQQTRWEAVQLDDRRDRGRNPQPRARLPSVFDSVVPNRLSRARLWGAERHAHEGSAQTRPATVRLADGQLPALPLPAVRELRIQPQAGRRVAL